MAYLISETSDIVGIGVELNRASAIFLAKNYQIGNFK